MWVDGTTLSAVVMVVSYGFGERDRERANDLWETKQGKLLRVTRNVAVVLMSMYGTSIFNH